MGDGPGEQYLEPGVRQRRDSGVEQSQHRVGGEQEIQGMVVVVGGLEVGKGTDRSGDLGGDLIDLVGIQPAKLHGLIRAVHGSPAHLQAPPGHLVGVVVVVFFGLAQAEHQRGLALPEAVGPAGPRSRRGRGPFRRHLR